MRDLPDTKHLYTTFIQKALFMGLVLGVLSSEIIGNRSHQLVQDRPEIM